MKEKKTFLELLDLGRPVLSDGAMGTLLHQRGARIDECFDTLNLTNPALVAQVHREYIEAGSQIIQTNTFGANRYKLSRFSLESKVKEINQAAVDLVRRVASASFKDILIAGDVGPLGVRLAPFGRVQLEDARAAFREQIQALFDAGVDLLIIETITDLYEIREAILAAREVSKDIPIVASMSFTRDDRTLLGDSPVKVARGLWDAGANVIGANCSGGPNQILRILKQMRHAVPDGRFSVMPNAGFPEQSSGRVMYSAAADYFGEYALSFWEAGADLIGGCCGTTPDHILAMRNAIDTNTIEKMPLIDENGQDIIEPASFEQPTQLSQKLARGEFVVAVEMDPPRGLSAHKLIAGASLLKEAGADVINVADSPMARMRMSPWAVCSLIQHEVGIETVLHFPTRGRNMLRVQGDLLAAHTLGVRNVFVVMGDPTAIGDYPDAMDNYDLTPSGLIKLIREDFNSGVDHAGSDLGQAATFFTGCALNLKPPDLRREVKLLQRKILAGANFILTQPIYKAELVTVFLEQYRDAYGNLPIPLLVGLLPLASSRHAIFLQNEVPGISIPAEIHQRMSAAGQNGAQEGIKIAIELALQIRKHAQGIYIMPAFNRFDYVAEIIEAVKGEA
jgi:methionine synthase I (cobalamin-dependent)/5,10-methylenetetrahydrofolate reductase